MFDLRDGLSSLIGDLGQSSPNENGTRDVVSHNSEDWFLIQFVFA